jgi:hypothetical protein
MLPVCKKSNVGKISSPKTSPDILRTSVDIFEVLARTSYRGRVTGGNKFTQLYFTKHLVVVFVPRTLKIKKLRFFLLIYDVGKERATLVRSKIQVIGVCSHFHCVLRVKKNASKNKTTRNETTWICSTAHFSSLPARLAGRPNFRLIFLS